MQQVLLFAGIGATLGGLAIVASRWTWTVWARIMLGVIPGLIGAIIIGVWQTDLVPDELESLLQPILLGIGSFAIGTLVVLELRAR
jgi:hypothetical protein